jgi:thiamine biosynthesis lipoprotein
MKFSLLIFVFVFHLNANTALRASTLLETTTQENHMGSVFQITAISEDEALNQLAIKKAYEEVERIEQLISEWIESSETSEINRNAGIQPVKVSDELFQLIYRSNKVSKITSAAFDISFASVDHIWKFDGSMTEIPDSATVAASVQFINFNDVELYHSDGTVFLKNKGMKIGFGAIGKGYAANRCKQIMLEMGIKSGVVNAGGDLTCWGTQKNGAPWTIGIADPNKKWNALSYLEISDMAVVTSGNYERFAIIDGQKFCHIIHPRTGWPVQHLKSVTIICPDAELADALATAVYVLGVKNGLAVIDQLKDVECFIIDENDQLFTSKNIELEYLKE